MPDTAILTALLTRLNAYSTSLPVAYLDKNWNGTVFTPPSSGMWIESRYFPNEPDDFLWSESQAMQMGFFQVSVHFRNEVFETLAGNEAGLIINHFPKGLVLTGDIKIRKQPWRSPKVTDEAMSFIPVTCPYRGLG